MLQPVGLQRVRHDLATEKQQQQSIQYSSLSYTVGSFIYFIYICMCVLSHFSSVPPGSSVHGILQARTLERVAISFSSNKV